MWGREAWSRKGKTQETKRASSLPVILSPKLRLSKVQQYVRINNQTLQPPTSMQELTINLPKIACLRGISPYPVFWALSTTWDYISSSSRHILAVLKYIPKSQQKEQTLRQRRKTCYYHLETHHSHTDDAVYNLLNVCSNRTTFKTTQDKNPKHAICNLYFWYACDIEAKSRSSNLESQHPRQCFNHAKFERSCLKVSEKKPMLKVVVVFQMRKYANYLPWTCAKIKNSGIFMIYLT